MPCKFTYHHAFTKPKPPNYRQLTRTMEVPNAADHAGGVSLLFTTAPQIFSDIQSAAQFSEIDEVQRVKTEVEKVRLIIWGQSVGLDGSPEKRDDALNVALGGEYLRTAVSGLLLNCFIKIFEDSEKLKDRYGLVQRVNQGPGSSHYLLVGFTFWRTYKKYGGHTGRHTHLGLGRGHGTPWINVPPDTDVRPPPSMPIAEKDSPSWKSSASPRKLRHGFQPSLITAQSVHY